LGSLHLEEFAAPPLSALHFPSIGRTISVLAQSLALGCLYAEKSSISNAPEGQFPSHLSALHHTTMCPAAPPANAESANVLPHLNQEVPMASVTRPGWSKPSTILFASEIPANEKAFAFALAQAVEFSAHLILFHAYDTLVVAASETSGIRYYDYAAAARAETKRLEPLAQRARDAGLNCEIVVRPGLPADQILSLLLEREVDRIVMGTHSPGPLGKLLVGSVAEAVLRSASVPVYIIGPDVVDGTYRKFATRSILCAVSLHEAAFVVAQFAAELAAQHNARLILQHVVKPQERAEALAGRTIDQVESGLFALVPPELQGRITVQTIVVPGDPTEELLYQARAQLADLIVLGAQGASAFAAIARHGVVYKVLAHAHAPVITLSPVVLADCGVRAEKKAPAEVYMAGVF
jgi:nucleotide-binding universal stress UspA family protein